MKLDILIVNINNIGYTNTVLECLKKQTNKNFHITLIDQNSSEIGTDTFLSELDETIKIIRNNDNVDLNRVWNEFYSNSKEDALCFLNNDILLTENFVDDTLKIFKLEKDVDVVVHATNHPDFIKAKDTLDYVICQKEIRQGWDFSIRKTAYKPIPIQLRVYCGDDFIFQNIYNNGGKVAFALSSPIIHYCCKSIKFRKVGAKDDIAEYKALGFKHNLWPWLDVVNIYPDNDVINRYKKENNI